MDERELTKFEEESLKNYFINEIREIDGRGITKDNYENMFDNWVEGLGWLDIDLIVKKYTK